MDHLNLEPYMKNTVSILIAILFFLILFTSAFGAWAYYRPLPEPIELVSEEGAAKAAMIKQLTGIEFPPEIAKWATITFSGTTVSIETQSINLWDGKKWR